MAKVYGKVDEYGHLGGFRLDEDDDISIGSFGDGLEGRAVIMDDGSAGVVLEVFQNIQCGNPGVGYSQYCAVLIVVAE